MCILLFDALLLTKAFPHKSKNYSLTPRFSSCQSEENHSRVGIERTNGRVYRQT